MPVLNIKTITPEIHIPTESDAVVKIVITDDSSTNWTVLNSYSGTEADNYTINASFTRVATDRLGSFKITLTNIDGIFLNKFDGGEVVNFYSDYTDATTLVFRGRIDNVKYGLDISNGFFIDITGRDYPEMVDKTITGVEASSTGDIAIAGILNEFYPDVTLVFWNGSQWAEATYNSSTDTVSWSPSVSIFPTTLLNMTYQHKKGWSVITEICKRIGLDCYIEYDGSKWTLRTFLIDDIINSNEAIAYGTNLINMGEYGADKNELYNRAIVYGKTESDNILLLKTENDTNSQSNLWIKDKIENEQSIDSMDEVQDKADFVLSEGISIDAGGRIKTLMLTSLRPGENINFTVPYTTANGNHRVQQFTHNFSRPFSTSLELTKKIKTIKDLFIPAVNAEEFISPVSNPNAMTDSYTIYFNETTSLMTHVNTEESDGRLRLQTGQTTGTATSDTLTTDQDITKCEFRKYENYETINDTYEVSNSGGAVWETYSTSGGVHSFDIEDNRLKFRMKLSRTSSTATSPAYESVSLLYK